MHCLNLSTREKLNVNEFLRCHIEILHAIIKLACCSAGRSKTEDFYINTIVKCRYKC